jgi:hypothetical protein
MCVPVGDANESCQADVADAVSVVNVEPSHLNPAVPAPADEYNSDVADDDHGANCAPSAAVVTAPVSANVPFSVQNTLSFAATNNWRSLPSQKNARFGVKAADPNEPIGDRL